MHATNFFFFLLFFYLQVLLNRKSISQITQPQLSIPLSNEDYRATHTQTDPLCQLIYCWCSCVMVLYIPGGGGSAQTCNYMVAKSFKTEIFGWNMFLLLLCVYWCAFVAS